MENIRVLREKRQATQQDIADSIGVTRQLISALESGQANPSVGTLVKLAKYFCISIDELLKEKENADASIPDP